MEVIQDKRELRARMKEVRSGISSASRELQSKKAAMLAESEWLGPLRSIRGQGLTLFCYLSFGDELDTSFLVRRCLELGDTVLVPKVEGRLLRLYRVNDHFQTVPGLWGIPEPPENGEEWGRERYRDIDAVIVPGLAFDRAGGRIGYGGGYYDRFISTLTEMDEKKAGNNAGGRPAVSLGALAFHEQLIEERIPMEQHDVRLDFIVSPDGIIRIGS